MADGPLTALLVDDDEDQRQLVVDMLRSGPLPVARIVGVPSVRQGVAALAEHDFDVGLVDYLLGDGTGLDLVREARRNGSQTPLIMLTGHASRDIDVEAMRAGADDFLEKDTLTPASLERAMRYAVEAARGRRQLRESEELFRALIQHASDAILLLDARGRITFASDSFESITGLSPKQAMGMDVFSRIHPDDVARLRTMFAECVSHPGLQCRAEYRALHADGMWRDREIVAVNRLDTPAVRAIVLNYRDVTERKRQERERAQTESQYRIVFEESPVGLAHATLTGQWMECNARLIEMLGYSAEEMRALTFADITHPDDLEQSIRGTRNLTTGVTTRHELEKRYRRKDGSYIWTRVHASLLRDHAGVPEHLIAAIEDISSRKAMEQELEQTVARLQGIFANLPLSVWALDRDGVYTFTDGRLLERFGYKPGDLVGQSQLELYADHPEVVEVTQRALRGEHVHMTYTLGDGTYEVWYAPLKDQHGAVTGTLGVATDITARVRLEEQFRQAQKMEAIGRLAGGVAHDFNNLLTAILGYTELALDEVTQGSDLHRDMQEVQKAAQSAAGLTRQLLAFSRRQILQPENINLNLIVARVQGLLRRLIGEDIQLQTVLAEDLEEVFADPTQMEQILLNLSINARDAMPSGGRLVIETGNVNVEDDDAEQHPGAARGRHVMLAVSDTGVGMDVATKKRLFEPFFTTKERGRGTGLGLATVYGIVKQSGGSIWVDSELHRGSTFKVLLPVAAPGVRIPVDVSDTQRSLRGTETVLVVEDQPEVRSITRETLRRHGYTVIDAASPDEALALVRETRARVDLLFTDVVMPQRTGRELAVEIRALLPHIKVIFTSGYTESPIVHQSVLAPGLTFLAKPYTARQLLKKLREVLDSGRTAEL